MVLEAPNISDASRWESAFVTSTSRLVLPIDVCELPGGGEPWQAKDHTVTEEIRAKVFEMMVAVSEAILA